jgi:hypothetical protein
MEFLLLVGESSSEFDYRKPNKNNTRLGSKNYMRIDPSQTLKCPVYLQILPWK